MPKRKKIAARVEFFTADLFGRHVSDGADRGSGAREHFVGGNGSAGEDAYAFTHRSADRGATSARGNEFCEAEIENFGVAAARDEKIRGLDIAVDNSLRMRGVERVGDFDGNFEEAIELHRLAGDYVLQRGAIEKFHGDEGFAVFFADVVDGADARVIQCGGSLGFTLKAAQSLRIAGYFFGKKFQCDETVETRVFGFVDDAHAAAAEFFDDAVMRNGEADERRVGFGHRGWSLERG